jgi:RNA polymerase sigma factor (sigma-70 family)
MATASLGGFLLRLRKAMAAGTLSSLSDRQLIERFLGSHEEASFQAILERHGPMVLRVCRRVLSDEQDMEDAFQATFLVLSREARVIHKHESLASWLHGVAYRVALDARKSIDRRRKHESRAAVCTCTAELTDDIGWKELRSVLDAELVKLPERLKAPLVLCYLQGLTQDEAAAQLGQTKSTFRRNLERGRELLGGRLNRRGVTFSAALFAPFLSECAANAALPSALATSTTDAAVALGGGKALAALASARAVALAQGCIQPVLSAKVTCVCALLLGTLLIGFGGAALPKEAPPIDPPPAERRQVANGDEPKAAERIEFRFPWIAMEAKVQTELKLTIEQVRAIEAVVGPSFGRPIEPGQRPEGDNRGFPVDALRAKLSEILTDVQARRLRQLEIQVLGTSAFRDPANVKLLALTEEQRDQVRAITGALGLEDGRTPLQRKAADIAAVRRILEILADVQRKAWRDIAGEEFDFEWSPTPGTMPGARAAAGLPGSVPPKER